MKDLKSQFPIFKNNPNLIYFDNAATTQKPKTVIDAIKNYYENTNANVHRGLYKLSNQSTQIYEKARNIVAKFINSKPNEIIFTGGTTDSINGIVSSLILSNIISPDKDILITELEHHSNILPYLRLKNNKKIIKINSNLQIDINKFTKQINKNIAVVAITYISNITGTINNIEKIVKIIRGKSPNALIILDAAQAVAHKRIDVKKLDVDFCAFSIHKMYGPTGQGVLFGKEQILQKIEPFQVGGGMINSVNLPEKQSKNSHIHAQWADIPWKFEAGTPAIAQSFALIKAIEFIEMIGFEKIEKHEQKLRNYALKKLKKIKNIKIFHPNIKTHAAAVISFAHNKIHSHDLAEFLGENNICTRAGHHCSQILHEKNFKVSSTLRISFGIYNNENEIDNFIKTLKQAIKFFK